MSPLTRKVITTTIILCTGFALYFGWREFWFLTDDAFIAFRYVSNSILGHGYVWNPEPFRPVEGYTSFLYVVILEWVWRLFGNEPPESANYISLIFSFGTIAVTSIAVMKLRLNDRLEPYRPLILGFVLFGLVSNTSFLTWSSSGLETAMFNFFFLSWILAAFLIREKDNRWKLIVCTLSALLYLSRPDGILAVLGTLILISYVTKKDIKKKQFTYFSLLSMLPILIPPVHLIWRRSFYGEWLPNTYYAKFVNVWPEAGVRYFFSFIIEYGIWAWIILLCVVVALRIKQLINSPREKSLSGSLSNVLETTLGNNIFFIVPVSCLIFHLGYYTLIVGGDHFEWRIYSHLPPLILLSTIYFLNYLGLSLTRSATIFATLLFASLPISWTYHFEGKEILQLEQKETLQLRISDRLPFFMRPLSRMQDDLQLWLTSHLICIRRREHQLFYESMASYLPIRSYELPPDAGQFPVTVVSNAGVAGWVVPKVMVIDGYGLNDYIIARFRGKVDPKRMMAHDRTPPDNYLYSFSPNVFLAEGGIAAYNPRPPQKELTAEKIRAIEKYWVAVIIEGQEIPDSLAPFSLNTE